MNTRETTSNNNNTLIVPYCYKIKEDCPINNSTKNLYSINKDDNSKCDIDINCVKKLAKYMSFIMNNPNSNPQRKEKLHDDIFYCLKDFGDIYKNLEFDLYVNPKTKQVHFPDNNRIQSNLNTFLRNLYNPNNTNKDQSTIDYKLKLYNIILNDELRKKYNEWYYSLGDINSLQPKSGGKRVLKKTCKRKICKKKTCKRKK